MLPVERLTRQAGSPGRIGALNLQNTPGQDGIIRGSILPVGEKQSTVNFAVAVVTLSAFVLWPYVMALLFLSSARPEGDKHLCTQLQLQFHDSWLPLILIRYRRASLATAPH